MTTSMPLRCSCGKLRGVADNLSPKTGTRLICMCTDCQTYAEFLGRAEELLDRHGGTEIYQLTPSQVRITEGAEHLACMRQSPKGAMRWYASCCNTPIANTTANPQVPFAGIPMIFFDAPPNEGALVEAFGPIRIKAYGRDSRGPMPADAHPKIPASFMLRALGLMAWSRLRGRHRPSPFFGKHGARAEPKVLSKDERDRLKRKVAAV